MKTNSIYHSNSCKGKSATRVTTIIASTLKVSIQTIGLTCLISLTSTPAHTQAVSLWNDATIPALPEASDANPIEVGLKFRSTVDGYITGIRFYKGVGNTGTHVGHLWTSSGTLLGSATFANESASGWQEQAMLSPVAISSNTTYVISYHAPGGHYAGDLGYFASSGFDNPPLRALANGEDGPNGVYIYGSSGTFPNLTFNSANYWVDVVFTQTLGSDTNPPTVTSINPPSGAVAVSVGTAVTISFSEALNPSTVNSANLQLLDAGLNSVATTILYVPGSLTATLTPNSLLTPLQTYTVTVAGVKDVAGNPLTPNFTSPFTTGSQTAFSIWDNSINPTVPSADDPEAIELGLKFKSAINGLVTGIRFYKGLNNTGAHVGNLWTSTGTLLTSVTFSNETASGWQTQALPSPVPINSNTTYIVSYHTPAGGYAVDSAYFASAGVDNYPLRALADGEDGPNGVYAYSANSTFPDQTYNAANYWVDVVVTVASDTTPPEIFVPADVLLDCGDCNTDPTNTGVATATDSSNVTITYTDMVRGDCPKVVKRTWTATDAYGNTASALQTVTCLPPVLVTDSSRCIFDRDPATATQDFRLIFIQDPQNWPHYKLAASNPGQFLYNLFYTGTPGQQVTFNVTLPYPFVTQGANPIHAFDGVTVTGEDADCLVPGKEFPASSQQVTLANYRDNNQPLPSATFPVTLTVPASGVVYLSIHLDFGLKKISGFDMNFNDDAVSESTSPLMIPNHTNFQFGVSGPQNGIAVIQNINAFKCIPGVAGLVLRQGSNNPVPGAVVTLKNTKLITVGSTMTDEDGFYLIAYKYTGRMATFYVSITSAPAYQETTTTNLKANAFNVVDFLIP